MRGSPARRVWRTVEQVFYRVIDTHRVHQLAWIHAVLRIPDRLELAEGLHQLRTEHLRQQCGSGLAVAMLAAERPAKAENQIGGAVDELAEVAQSVLRSEVEVDAQMDASLAVVPV